MGDLAPGRPAVKVRLTKPTHTQHALYAYLFSYTMERGYQPSMREVSAHFGWSSPAACQCHLERLERFGWLRQGGGEGKEARAIRFLRRPDGGHFYGFTPRVEPPV